MKKYIIKFILYLISMLDKLIKKNNNLVVYNSFPDLSDNSFALFLYIIKNHPEKENIWLINNIKEFNINNIKEYTNKTNFICVKRDSIKGIYYYLRAKYVFFTHGLYAGAEVSSSHCVINLWHGMPLKTIGLLGNNTVVQNSSYLISTSTFYKEIMAKAMGLEEKRVIVTGQPRNDLMYDKSDCLEKLNINTNKTIILWTPTYRQSIVGDIRTDGLFDNNLPIVKDNELEELNIYLGNINSYMIIKLHPMDILNKKQFSKYTNIKILNTFDFKNTNIQLYSLLGKADILLTDFSSIYIDYLLLDKPIGFIMDDIVSYENSRGFVFSQPLDYMPGPQIENLNKLKLYLSDITKGIDSYSEKRKRINFKLNKHYDSYSKELLSKVNFA